VLDFTRILSGPYATLLLADQGAEIIKVEAPRRGDETRHYPPFRGELSHYFTALNRNKKSIVLDLSKKGGKEIARELAAQSDVVIENFRPGVMDRLGLGYKELSARNPGLIFCAISGFGSEGPLRDRPAFDIVAQALSGVMSINGEPGGRPTKLGLPIGDMIGGIYGTIGILSALHERKETGKGCFIDISMLDGLLGALGYLAQIYFVTGESPQPFGTKHASVVPYGAFKTSDGYIIIACLTDEFWQKLAAAIEREDLVSDLRFAKNKDRVTRREEVDALVEERTVTRTTAEWAERLRKFDVPHAPILSVGEALKHPSTLARGMVGTVTHPDLGDIQMVRNPIRYEGKERTLLMLPPELGQHTEDILRSILHFTSERIEELRDEGAINSL